MITTTSINTTVLLKVLHAMSEAQNNGIAHVRNRKGQAFLAVRKIVINGRVMFQVLNKKGQNIKAIVSKAVITLMNKHAVTYGVAEMFIKRIGYEFELGRRETGVNLYPQPKAA